MSGQNLHWYSSLVSATGAAQLRITPFWGEDSLSFSFFSPKKRKKGLDRVPCPVRTRASEICLWCFRIQFDQRWRVYRRNDVCSPSA